MKSPCNRMEIHLESSLIAVVTDELIIYVLDIDTKKIVRKLKGPTNAITDMVQLYILKNKINFSTFFFFFFSVSVFLLTHGG